MRTAAISLQSVQHDSTCYGAVFRRPPFYQSLSVDFHQLPLTWHARVWLDCLCLWLEPEHQWLTAYSGNTGVCTLRWYATLCIPFQTLIHSLSLAVNLLTSYFREQHLVGLVGVAKQSFAVDMNSFLVLDAVGKAGHLQNLHLKTSDNSPKVSRAIKPASFQKSNGRMVQSAVVPSCKMLLSNQRVSRALMQWSARLCLASSLDWQSIKLHSTIVPEQIWLFMPCSTFRICTHSMAGVIPDFTSAQNCTPQLHDVQLNVANTAWSLVLVICLSLVSRQSLWYYKSGFAKLLHVL